MKDIAKATGLNVDTIRQTFKEVVDDENFNSRADDRIAESARTPNTAIVVSDGYGGALAFEKNKGSIPKGVSYDKESDEIHATYRNALLLIGSERWDLGYNELTQNYGLRGEVTYPWPTHLGFALTDAIQREIRLWLLRRWGVTFSIQDVEQVTMTLARRNTFNPVCDYLDAVEGRWDGIPRVERWLETYMGVTVTNENSPYVRAIGKIVLVAAVRRARDPGCKFDEMMILEGPQGGGKSTAVKILGGDWFGDSNLGDPWFYILTDYLVGKSRVMTKDLLGDEDALNLPPERQTQTTMKKLKSLMARMPGWQYKASLRVGEQRTAGYEYVPPV